jgi:Ca2+-binding EF-hand superfamily protein
MSQKLIKIFTILVLSTVITSASYANDNQAKRFKQMDADKNGTVNVEELAAGLAKGYERKAKRKGFDQARIQKDLENMPETAKNRMSLLDTDGDGELSLEEFSAPPAKGKGKPEGKKGKKKDKEEKEN